MLKNEKCIFCKMIKENNYEIENEYAVLKIDDNPASDGHMIVIIKRHAKDWWSSTNEERLAIFDLLDRAHEIIDKKYHPDGYNIGVNIGAAAGQTIMHLHVHLIPRYVGDVEKPRGGVRGVIRDKQDY